MEREYFKTWDRPEYQEWATPTEEGYELYIIREEQPNQFLVVKAKLIMGEKGLPGFEVLEEYHLPTSEEGMRQIETWKEALQNS